jgi:hypothetical protein
VCSDVIIWHVKVVGPVLCDPAVCHVEHTRTCADLSVLWAQTHITVQGGGSGGKQGGQNTKQRTTHARLCRFECPVWVQTHKSKCRAECQKGRKVDRK